MAAEYVRWLDPGQEAGLTGDIAEEYRDAETGETKQRQAISSQLLSAVDEEGTPLLDLAVQEPSPEAAMLHSALASFADPRLTNLLAVLSNRERQYFDGLARGLNHAEIAAELNVTPNAARQIKHRMMQQAKHIQAEIALQPCNKSALKPTEMSRGRREAAILMPADRAERA